MKKTRIIIPSLVALVLVALAVGMYFGKYWLKMSAGLAQTQTQTVTQDDYIKSQVQSAYAMLDELNAKVKSGELKKSYAQKLGADILRNMTYGKDGYFFADTSKGVNVVLYGDKTVEGTNRRDANVNGVYYVQEIAKAAQNGGGYTDYHYPKKGETDPSAKRAYSMYFEPFDWVIGTGYYR
ncbi:MAG: cache domain-containing protein [Patescibacteria group bacterium]|jgi:methyl-accepting chemotaxis protein